jgi:hypothetical protein
LRLTKRERGLLNVPERRVGARSLQKRTFHILDRDPEHEPIQLERITAGILYFARDLWRVMP